MFAGVTNLTQVSYVQAEKYVTSEPERDLL